jgi:hypothetical protein
MPDDDGGLKVPAAARIAKVHPRTLRKALQAGELAGRLIPGPGGWRTTRAAVLAWLEGRPPAKDGEPAPDDDMGPV